MNKYLVFSVFISRPISLLVASNNIWMKISVAYAFCKESEEHVFSCIDNFATYYNMQAMP
jgi:hypothetical protein